ncbi:uncharacterized protein LOC126669535 [Mercurialis annua]|uniref:uncharacterized protein LOC126669535 n=1 Tax=Mercurialis annua TaxID=3986 RepID=UPI00215F1519|nr:uncharacterized protein LOC126669535 [Mercurialis annua]
MGRPKLPPPRATPSSSSTSDPPVCSTELTGIYDVSITDQDSNMIIKTEEDFDLFTVRKINEVAQPLVEELIPFKIHIVKDHDMKERLCEMGRKSGGSGPGFEARTVSLEVEQMKDLAAPVADMTVNVNCY